MHYRMPDDLSARAKEAADVVIKAAEEHSPRKSDPGHRDFYSQAEWRARGERYGRDAVLIVVHDGGSLAPLFNLDYEAYKAANKMNKAIRDAGFVSEICTGWYTAIYDVNGKEET